MAKTSNYWDKRAIKRMTEAEKHSEAYIKRIKKIYEQAYRNVNREINRVYWNYYKDTGVDIDKLKELLTRSETEKLWEQMKKQGLDRFIKNNYKSRISRLEQIQAQIYAKAKLIYPKEELEQTMCYKGVVNNSYYKAVYDTQMGTGYDFAFNKIDKNLVSSILNEKWSGKNYSQRIWKNTDILAESVSQLVGGALLSGQSIQKTTREIKERFKVGKYYAERLVRTETNHFNNEADALAYEEMGVDEYVFVATLDDRTSPMCQSHDNKKYKYKDREVGVNYPPLHPNCRSTTRGYLGEEAEVNLQRRARNPKTGRTELIGNISYEEWAKNNGLTDNRKVPSNTVKPKTVIKPLTEEDKKALEYYVSGEGMYINNYLRGRAGVNVNDMVDVDKEFVNKLDHATNRPLKSQTLYRSVDANAIFGNISDTDYENLRNELIYHNFSKGNGAYSQTIAEKCNKLINDSKDKIIIDKGYVSTTKDYDIAKDWGDFTGSDKPIVLELNLDDTVKGVDLDFLDVEDDPQKETLLARNQSFKVKEITAKDGNIYVKADVTNKIDNLKKIPKNDIINNKDIVIDWGKIEDKKYTKEQAIKQFKNVYDINFKDSRKYPIDEELLSKCTSWLDTFENTYNIKDSNKVKIPSVVVKPASAMLGEMGHYTYYVNSSDVVELALNGRYFTDKKSLLDIVNKSFERKSKSTNNIIHTFIHEYGHHISNSLRWTTGDITIEHKIISECIEEFKKTHTDYQYKTYIGLKDYLSNYGTTNESECFAEAFAEAYGTSEPREFAKIFKNKLDKVLKEVFKNG